MRWIELDHEQWQVWKGHIAVAMLLAIAIALSACKVGGVDGKVTLDKGQAPDTQATLGSAVAAPASTPAAGVVDPAEPVTFAAAEAVYRDGRYDIVVEGRRRFEVTSLERTRPYLRADVRFLEEPEGEEDPGLAEAVAKLFEGVLESVELSGQAVIDETWKDLDARSLSYKVASALPVGEDAKQEILEIPDTAARLRRVAEALMALRRIGAAAGAG